MQYFEDIETNAPVKFGRYEVTRDEVIEFAKKYDPQPFHLDDEVAAKTHFGKIAASGWHSCSMTMAMMVEHFKSTGFAGLGGAGVDKLRWIRPVYPGDILHAQLTVLEKRQSKTRPEIGFLSSEIKTFNQKDELVMSMQNQAMVKVRDPDKAASA